ncbi:MAG: ABC transporter permease subunit [Promethearchaeota archaeon]
MDKNLNHIWSFPLVGGVLTLIGLFTPASILLSNFFWFFGLIYVDADPTFNYFYWNPETFFFNLIPLILLSGLSIAVIVLAIISRKGDFKRFYKFWLILGGLFFIPPFIHLFWALFTFGSFIRYFIPGFAFITPFISGTIIILGTLFNSRVLMPPSQRRDLIIKIKKCYRNILCSLSIGAVIFLFGSIISFSLIYILPGDPVLAYLAAHGIFSPSPAQYTAAQHLLGLHLPPFLQFFMFLCQTFTGNLGDSFTIAPATPVIDILGIRATRMIEFMLLPLIIVVGLGFLLGRFLAKKRGKWYDKFIQLLQITVLAFPVFIIGMACQFYLAYGAGIIPSVGYKSIANPDPTLRTGFLIFDSLLDGSWALAIDIFYHLLTPMIILGVSTFALIAWQTRSYIGNKSHKKSLLRHTVITGSIFGFIFMFYILIDFTFNLNFLGSLLIDAINLVDHFVLMRSLFVIVVIFVIVLTISTISFCFYKYIKSVHAKPKSEPSVEEKANREKDINEISSEENNKKFLIRKTKDLSLPLGIVGAILMIFLIIIAIFPQLITEYTLAEASAVQLGAWNPPSPDHPLGQTALGGDVLGLVMYGIQDSMLFGIMAVLISLVGGIPLGYLAGRFRKWGYKLVMAAMVFFYTFPMFIIVLLFLGILGTYYGITLLIVGVLMVPNFTRVIANIISGNIRVDLYRTGKKLLAHIPLNFSIAVLIYATLGFLRFTPSLIPQQLGNLMNIGRSNLYSAPWASLWAGFAIFGITFTFLLLYLAFQHHNLSSRKFKLKFGTAKNRSKSLENMAK